jgi:hypothetical protein
MGTDHIGYRPPETGSDQQPASLPEHIAAGQQI